MPEIAFEIALQSERKARADFYDGSVYRVNYYYYYPPLTTLHPFNYHISIPLCLLFPAPCTEKSTTALQICIDIRTAPSLHLHSTSPQREANKVSAPPLPPPPTPPPPPTYLPAYLPTYLPTCLPAYAGALARCRHATVVARPAAREDATRANGAPQCDRGAHAAWCR